MQENTTLNAFLALLENKPEIFRKYLRSTPGLPAHDVTTIQARIYQALDQAKTQASRAILRQILMRSMRISTSRVLPLTETEAQKYAASGDFVNRYSTDMQNAFLQGVQAVEEEIELILEKLDGTEDNAMARPDPIDGQSAVRPTST